MGLKCSGPVFCFGSRGFKCSCRPSSPLKFNPDILNPLTHTCFKVLSFNPFSSLSGLLVFFNLFCLVSVIQIFSSISFGNGSLSFNYIKSIYGTLFKAVTANELQGSYYSASSHIHTHIYIWNSYCDIGLVHSDEKNAFFFSEKNFKCGFDLIEPCQYLGAISFLKTLVFRTPVCRGD